MKVKRKPEEIYHREHVRDILFSPAFSVLLVDMSNSPGYFSRQLIGPQKHNRSEFPNRSLCFRPFYMRFRQFLRRLPLPALLLSMTTRLAAETGATKIFIHHTHSLHKFCRGRTECHVGRESQRRSATHMLPCMVIPAVFSVTVSPVRHGGGCASWSFTSKRKQAGQLTRACRIVRMHVTTWRSEVVSSSWRGLLSR